MKNLAILILLILSVKMTKAQTEEFVYPGLIRTQGTLCAGSMLQQKVTHFYFHGALEGYLNKLISFTGENYIHLGNTSPDFAYPVSHSLFFGSNIHYVKDRLDIYIGIQPGVCYAHLKNLNLIQIPETTFDSWSLNPLISGTVGCNFFVSKLFDFFVNARVIHGNYLSQIKFTDNQVSSMGHGFQVPLDEIRISAGLGWHFGKI